MRHSWASSRETLLPLISIFFVLYHGKCGLLTPHPLSDLTAAEQQKLERRKVQADQKNPITMKMRFWYEL
jgi:hypothetical protein